MTIKDPSVNITNQTSLVKFAEKKKNKKQKAPNRCVKPWYYLIDLESEF